MKWLPRVTQTVRDTQDQPACPQSLSFPIHEHISSDTRELWLAVGLEETQRRPSGREVHLSSQSLHRASHTGYEDTGCAGSPLALRRHLHSKPDPLLSCSETLDPAPNLLSASFPSSTGLQKGLCFQRYANHLACSPALSTIALLLTY